MNLSTIDFILLLILKAQPDISGYDIDRIIEEREYRRWTEIGKSSVYIRLQILKKKGLISSRIGRQKTGRGPLPTFHSLTKKGEQIFEESLIDYLGSYSSNDVLYDLSLSSIHMVKNKNKVLQALKKRTIVLSETKSRLRQKLIEFAAYPINVKWVLEKHLQQASSQYDFTNKLIISLKKHE